MALPEISVGLFDPDGVEFIKGVIADVDWVASVAIHHPDLFVSRDAGPISDFLAVRGPGWTLEPRLSAGCLDENRNLFCAKIVKINLVRVVHFGRDKGDGAIVRCPSRVIGDAFGEIGDKFYIAGFDIFDGDLLNAA